MLFALLWGRAVCQLIKLVINNIHILDVMVKESLYKAFDSVVIRMPLFPLSYLSNIDYENELFNEAIYIASPELYAEWKGQSTLTNKMNQTLYKYWTRMCTRATPFGLFASCSVGTQSTLPTNIKVKDGSNIRRHSRLDMDYLCLLTSYLEEQPDIQEHLHYLTNDSLYPLGDKFRYITINRQNGKRKFNIEEIERFEELESLLHFAQTPRTKRQLIHFLIGLNVECDEASHFLNELIKQQVLTSSISVSITGKEQFACLLETLEKCKLPIADKLLAVKEAIIDLDTSSAHSTKKYESLYLHLNAIGIPYDLKHIIQVDSFRDLSASTINVNVSANIQDALLFLQKARAYSIYSNNHMLEFKKRFIEKYGDQEQLLLRVLDNENGIGYPVNKSYVYDDPIFNGLKFDVDYRAKSDTQLSFIEALILQKYILMLKEGRMNDFIELLDSDIPEGVTSKENLPPTISVICRLYGDLIELKAISGNASRLIGRFCYLDPNIEHLANDICSAEQTYWGSNVEVVELSHITQDRIGNIAARPLLRQSEIHYLTRSGAPFNQQLSASQIMICIKNGELCLFSNKDQTQIIPSISNAHNYTLDSTPFYRFLGDYQANLRTSPYLFTLYNLLEVTQYIPRIVYKKCILSAAQWIVEYPKDANLSAETLTKIIEKKDLPRYVTISEGDMDLFIDFTNPICCEIFIEHLRKRKKIKLVECLINETVCSDGNYNPELLFSFYLDN